MQTYELATVMKCFCLKNIFFLLNKSSGYNRMNSMWAASKSCDFAVIVCNTCDDDRNSSPWKILGGQKQTVRTFITCRFFQTTECTHQTHDLHPDWSTRQKICYLYNCILKEKIRWKLRLHLGLNDIIDIKLKSATDDAWICIDKLPCGAVTAVCDILFFMPVFVSDT